MVYTARLAGRNGFEKLLQAQQIKQKNGSPGHPQTQGKIERFHQTLKRWLAARARPADITQLQTLLDRFHNRYNDDRPHRAVGRTTPAQAYTALPKATPSTDPEPEWRTRTDTIDPHGKVTLRYAGRLRHLGIARAHTGTPILMLIRDTHVMTSDANTGTVIAEHHPDPDRDYQPPQHRTRAPAPSPNPRNEPPATT